MGLGSVGFAASRGMVCGTGRFSRALRWSRGVGIGRSIGGSTGALVSRRLSRSRLLRGGRVMQHSLSSLQEGLERIAQALHSGRATSSLCRRRSSRPRRPLVAVTEPVGERPRSRREQLVVREQVPPAHGPQAPSRSLKLCPRLGLNHLLIGAAAWRRAAKQHPVAALPGLGVVVAPGSCPRGCLCVESRDIGQRPLAHPVAAFAPLQFLASPRLNHRVVPAQHAQRPRALEPRVG
mmetsp:Transcript_2899/g.11753  ORF Transcript_2899/g.11753 Transcript_2899/m.11753 type:complete len:236 (-) Transcript_2899:2007-2714(-)